MMELKRYKKRTYTIRAEKVPPGTSLYNFLEDCHYTTTDVKCIKLTGTVGEVWLITVEEMSKLYTFANGTPITAENIPNGIFFITTISNENAVSVFAERITKKIEITTRWGEVLIANREGVSHGEGDFIVYANENGHPNPNDRWVVNGMVFINTYEEV